MRQVVFVVDSAISLVVEILVLYFVGCLMIDIVECVEHHSLLLDTIDTHVTVIFLV